MGRFHAVLQHREGGSWYLMDLGSSHGTTLNKDKLKPRRYCRVRPGFHLQFGSSSRIYVIRGMDAQAKADMEKTRNQHSGTEKIAMTDEQLMNIAEETGRRQTANNPFAESKTKDRADPRKILQAFYDMHMDDSLRYVVKRKKK